MKVSPIERLRRRIDALDEKILRLLNLRAKEVLRIIQLKEKNNLDIYAPEREVEVLRRLKDLNKKGPLSSEDVEIIFREILSVFRSLQAKIKVAFFGPEGTFTHLASLKHFGKKAQYLACESISDVFEEVEKSRVDYGVVPIENSTEGAVAYTMDMFFSSPLKICAEITLSISHALLGHFKEKIKRIYSHPQVFAQCRKWLAQNYPHCELVPVSSTARAARKAVSDKGAACIGSKFLATLYPLKILAGNIEDFSENYTRFLVIAKNDSLPSGRDKTSILFSVQDRVGVLHDALASFKKHNINLTKIESRPSKRKPWEYYFFVDFEGHRSLPQVIKALEGLATNCIFVKILGSYPREG